MVIIGVDPGKLGAYAVIKDGKLKLVRPFKGDIRECRSLRDICKSFDAICYVEHVTASPQMGVVSAFTFGRWAESIDSAVFHAGKEPIKVRPAIWQNTLGVFAQGNKNVLYQKCKEIFPNEYKSKLFNKSSSDAVLIAHYGWCHYKITKGKK